MWKNKSSVYSYLLPVVAWVGVTISMVLLISHSHGTPLYCGPAAGCNAVTESRYSRFAGIPLSVIGTVAWSALLLGFTTWLFLQSTLWRRRLWMTLRISIFGGASISLGLIVIQAFILHAYCPLCLGSAVCFFVLAGLQTIVRSNDEPLFTPAAVPAVILGMVCTIGAIITVLLMGTPSPLADGPKLLAIIDGRQITDNDLPIEIRLAVQPLEEASAKLRMEWVDQQLDELVLKQEAKRQGTTLKTLLAKNTAATAQITDADIAAWHKGHADELMVSNEDITARLKLSREANAEDEYLAQLRKMHSATVLVHPPIPSLVHFDLSHAQLDGPANAPAIFVVFSDFECPFCRQLGINLRAVRRQLGDQVAVAFKNLPLDQIHLKAHAFALAAIAAGEQSKFWEYHDALISKEFTADDAVLIEQAKILALDVGKFTDAMHSKRVADRLADDIKLAEFLGLQQTPILFLNGRLSGGLQSTEDLIQAAQSLKQ